MKKYFALLILISTFQFISNTFCDDGLECPGNYTCCQGLTKYSCCPLEKATCCEDGFHCCPQGSQCNTKEKKCDLLNDKGEIISSQDLEELTPTSLLYKKGWNALYENCKYDIQLIKKDLIQIYFDIISGKKESMKRAKEDYNKLISDGKLTKNDCIKFFKDVFE